MKEKLNRVFTVSYIINCFVLLMTLFWLVNMFMYNSGNLLEDLAVGFVYTGLYLLNFLISTIILIITIILGIKNYKKSKNLKTKKTITLMMSLIGIVHIVILLFTIITILLA